MDNGVVQVKEKVQQMFGNLLCRKDEPWEQSHWSQNYKITLNDNTAYFLKGTPRDRNEAEITMRLHEVAPELIPKIIVDDLLPEASWRWFLMTDAGECSYENIELENALKAAFSLGTLQIKLMKYNWFQFNLPQCEGSRLREAVQNVGKWALKFANDVETEIITGALSIDKVYYYEHQRNLSQLPSTCVHKDLWSGNIAVKEGGVKLIDWGDAMWGVGGISIVNLILSDSNLSNHSQDIWNSYFKGLNRTGHQKYIESCNVAFTVSEIIVEKEIAALQKQKYGPGLIPSFHRLQELLLNCSS